MPPLTRYWVGPALGLAFCIGLLASRGPLLGMLVVGVGTVGLGALGSSRLQRANDRQLRTAANVLDAIRHGDYTHRARVDVLAGPSREVLLEVNELSLHLERERAKAEEAAALLQAIVQRVDVALLAFDDTACIRWWNQAAQQLFGAKLVANTPASELGMGDWLSGAPERAVLLPGPGSTGSWELRRGAFRQGGKRYAFLVLASLRRARREEERAAWQRLLRVIGHEVNNTLAPIQSLAGTCGAMLESDALHAAPDVQRSLEVIERRSESLRRFIGEFARLARLPTPKPVPTSLSEHVRRVVALDTRCPIHVAAQTDLTVLADGPLLEQALVNLIQNAVDAALVNAGSVHVDWTEEGDQAVLRIIDDGPGITNPDNLFVPLFSTKPGGSGIGLVLARNIIEAHRGDLTLGNRSHQAGCIARLALPLAGSQHGPRDDGSAPFESRPELSLE